ncbi:hypothetical protein GGR28_000889 [Lewinella aquimaris]|uniref:Outer membrane protein beta-barrel domain-containing protein n=1 Tax=Neolewinella aquimaris TaxID=1835722 RepID=A0A840E894_9BACT|nr:hypothetical protein [Neolewinella aquimaris]MBB4078288.1 hypothetical protein [Neolewinella aquimaris]
MMRYLTIVLLLALGLPLTAQTDSGPDRWYGHQLTTSVGMAQNSGMRGSFWGTEEFTQNYLSMGVEYHLIVPLRSFTVGIGPGLAVMDGRRRERAASLTGLVEYRLGQGRVRTVGRLTGGINLPVGHRDQPLESRSLGTVLHPSVGIVLTPPGGHWGSLLFDVGYRFTEMTLSTTNAVQQRSDREVTYRRLTFTTGIRF